MCLSLMDRLGLSFVCFLNFFLKKLFVLTQRKLVHHQYIPQASDNTPSQVFAPPQPSFCSLPHVEDSAKDLLLQKAGTKCFCRRLQLIMCCCSCTATNEVKKVGILWFH